MTIMLRRTLNGGVAWAGLFVAPIAWSFSTQANYAIVPWLCGMLLNPVPAIALAMAAISVGSGVLSWRSWQAASGGTPTERYGHPQKLLAGAGVLSAILFTVVILMQGAAGLILDGCER